MSQFPWEAFASGNIALFIGHAGAALFLTGLLLITANAFTDLEEHESIERWLTRRYANWYKPFLQLTQEFIATGIGFLNIIARLLYYCALIATLAGLFMLPDFVREGFAYLGITGEDYENLNIETSVVGLQRFMWGAFGIIAATMLVLKLVERVGLQLDPARFLGRIRRTIVQTGESVWIGAVAIASAYCLYFLFSSYLDIMSLTVRSASEGDFIAAQITLIPLHVFVLGLPAILFSVLISYAPIITRIHSNWNIRKRILRIQGSESQQKEEMANLGQALDEEWQSWDPDDSEIKIIHQPRDLTQEMESGRFFDRIAREEQATSRRKAATYLASGFIAGLSITYLLTFSFARLGEMMAGSSLDFLSTRVFLVNALFDSWTIVFTIYVMKWVVTSRFLSAALRIVIAFTLDILVAAAFAVAGLYLSLVGTPYAKSIPEVLDVLVAFNKLDGFFWVMHTTFIPTVLLWFGVIFLGFLTYLIACVVVGPILRKAYREQEHQDKHPGYTARPVLLIAGTQCLIVGFAMVTFAVGTFDYDIPFVPGI